MRSRSICTFRAKIWVFSSLPSLVVTEQAMMGRETPHARPRATFEGTKTYGTFLSSHRSGKCMRISIGSVSAAITMNSEIPRLRVLVTSLAPFLSCL